MVNLHIIYVHVIHNNSKQDIGFCAFVEDQLNLQFSCTHRNNILGAATTSAGTSWDTGRAHLQSCHRIQDSVDSWDTWRRSDKY